MVPRACGHGPTLAADATPNVQFGFLQGYLSAFIIAYTLKSHPNFLSMQLVFSMLLSCAPQVSSFFEIWWQATDRPFPPAKSSRSYY